MAQVVTISASYGANGDMIGRRLAERLYLPFVDRAFGPASAHAFAHSPGMEESSDEPVPGRWQRFFSGFANIAVPIGPSHLSDEVVVTPEVFRTANEAKLREIADTTGAVVLGHAGMIVLGKRPDVLCVRLDGPVESRIAQVVARGVDEASARRAQREVDRAREAYARVFFNVRQDDFRLYHLVLDSSALSVDLCVDVLVRAAWDRFGPRWNNDTTK